MPTLAFDSAPLCAFARAGRLETLCRLVEGYDCVTTRAVLDEIADGAAEYPRLAEVAALSWLRVEPVDDLPALRLFAEYARRLGAGRRDVGEATVLAWGEAHGAIVFTDDQAAVQAGRDRRVTVLRTLALVARGVRLHVLARDDARCLVDDLAKAGARFPCSPGEFLDWAQEAGIL